MIGARLTAGLECANDVGVRFTLWPSGDSQGPSRVSTGGAVSCASVARTAGAARAAPAVAGATHHQSEGLVRVRGRVCLRTPAPHPPGVAPEPIIPCGKASKRRGQHGGSTDPPPTAAIAQTYRSKRSPFRQTRDAPVPGVPRQPSCTGLMDGSDPQRRGGWGCTSPSSPMPIEACRDGGSLPSTSKERGSASALRWPWRNRKRASDMRNRRRAHHRRDFVSGHPQSAPDTRGSASAGRFLAPKTDSQPSLEAPRPKPPGPWIRTWESECTGPGGQPLGPARTPPLKPATGQQAPPTRRFKRADRAVHQSRGIE